MVTVRPPSERSASSIGTTLHPPACAWTDSSQTPCAPGASRRTTSGLRPTSVTARVHCRVAATSPWPGRGRPGTRRRPSGRRSCRPDRWATPRAAVGRAGRCARVPPTRSPRPLRRSLHVVTPAASSDNAVTAPGIADANESIIAGSTNAGTQRTLCLDRSAVRLRAHLEAWNDRAASHDADTLECHPCQPTQAGPETVPVAFGADRDQPSQPVLDLDRQCFGRTPPPSGTPGCTAQPCAGPPHRSRRVASSSFDAGVAPRPPAHTTMVPADHDACRTTSSGGRSISAGIGGRRRSAVLRKLRTVSVKSATTYSRSSPGSERADARPSSASPIRRFSNESDDGPPSRRAASRRRCRVHPQCARSRSRVVSCPRSISVHRTPGATDRQSTRRHVGGGAIGHRAGSPRTRLRNS